MPEGKAGGKIRKSENHRRFLQIADKGLLWFFCFYGFTDLLIDADTLKDYNIIKADDMNGSDGEKYIHCSWYKLRSG